METRSKSPLKYLGISGQNDKETVLEMRNTSRSHQGKEENVGQDVNEQLYANRCRSTLLSGARAGERADSG